ncbi:M15 family metallopeptidase [Danxiaibacter flavus]|uniref:D-alanyl-D-alanine dipeptidase n=1 Tax=Danxiaibacter flavus TaxID=3049108 RepID=A0ABV3ZA31_9BACT|nr:M15 family metallopeptidase [Chitinophagaceae bacterium DXS]
MLLVSGYVAAQSSIIVPKNKYKVAVITTKKLLEHTIDLDSNKQMVSLSTLIPDIAIELSYASTNNFTHQALYPSKTNDTYLRLPAAKALQKVQAALSSKNYGLKIFDAYRPYSVTKKFWELINDERYVANPAKASGHNKGAAVDLTIIDLKTKKELDMGTAFDNFTDSAHHSYTALPPKVLANRKLLKETMIKYGFKPLETEWWHYSWPGNFEALDVSFDDLGK